MNPVIISPEAEADLTEAYRWYEKQVEGLPALRSFSEGGSRAEGAAEGLTHLW